MGARDVDRLDDRGQRRLDRAAVPRPPRGVLPRDASDRARVRRARRHAAGRHRRVRGVRRGDARRRAARSGCRRSPANWPTSSSIRRWRRSRVAAAVARPGRGGSPGARAAGDVRLDAVAGGRAAAGVASGRTYGIAVGPPRAARESLAGGGLACLAPTPARRRSDRCRRRWQRIGGSTEEALARRRRIVGSPDIPAGLFGRIVTARSPKWPPCRPESRRPTIEPCFGRPAGTSGSGRTQSLGA